MQNLIDSIIVNHDNEAGFLGYSIDYGPSVVDRSRREFFASFPQARRFYNEQRGRGNSVAMFYIYDEV